MLRRRMPVHSVPCQIWLPRWGERDAYGNSRPTYPEQPDLVTECFTFQGGSRPETSDDIGVERPHGDVERRTFCLKKSFDADLRGAVVACPSVSDRRYAVEGVPASYPMDDTPGDYSWWVEGVARLG